MLALINFTLPIIEKPLNIRLHLDEIFSLRRFLIIAYQINDATNSQREKIVPIEYAHLRYFQEYGVVDVSFIETIYESDIFKEKFKRHREDYYLM